MKADGRISYQSVDVDSVDDAVRSTIGEIENSNSIKLGKLILQRDNIITMSFWLLGLDYNSNLEELEKSMSLEIDKSKLFGEKKIRSITVNVTQITKIEKLLLTVSYTCRNSNYTEYASKIILFFRKRWGPLQPSRGELHAKDAYENPYSIKLKPYKSFIYQIKEVCETVWSWGILQFICGALFLWFLNKFL